MRASISLRLTAWFSVVFLLGLALFGVAMAIDLRRALEAGRERTLRTRAERLLRVMAEVEGASDEEGRNRYEEFAQGTPEGRLIRVVGKGGESVFPVGAANAGWFAWPANAAEGVKRVKYRGTEYMLLTESAHYRAKAVWVQVAGQLNDNAALLRRFQQGLLAAIPAFLVLSGAGGYFLSRRALSPVDRLTTLLRSINIRNLSGRLPVSGNGDEMARLAETCNSMLQRLEGAVGQIRRFTADASHELRGPIAYTRTVAECALMNPEADEESRAAFNEIVRESERAAGLLADMLTIARADAGYGPALVEKVDLAAVLNEVYEKMTPMAEAREKRLSKRVEGTYTNLVRGDSESLQRLLWILIDNAIKYTPAGGQIEVSLLSGAGESTLKVSDNGRGIAPDDLERIFDRFYRVDPARSEAGGSGLGLAIAKWIADGHGARLTVESQVNVGSTFRVAFTNEGRSSEASPANAVGTL